MAGNQKSQHDPASHAGSWSLGKTIAALVAAVPLLGLTGAGVWKLVEFGKTQATVELQAKQIDELRADKLTLQTRVDSLESRSRSLEIKLALAEDSLAYTRKQLTETTALLSQSRTVAAELGESIKSNSPCVSIQKAISELEQRLDRDQAWLSSLSGPRREEAMAQLEQHQQSLRTCLTANLKGLTSRLPKETLKKTS
uniref:hypothetical protein n=1 Tax=Pseudomonas aeruginosa TaxID=287 RepID=UPI00356835DE